MRFLPTIATLALATQALASSSDFEVNSGDEIRLQPERTEGIPYRHQVPEKGQRKFYENEDIKLDGWRRGFSELKQSEKPALKTFEKRKGGGGGFGGGRSFGGGGRGIGSSFTSGGKSGGIFSGGGRSGGSSSSPSGSRSGGLTSSFGTGALTGGALGYLAGNHHGSSSSKTRSTPSCPQDCRCDNMDDKRLYFTVPSSLSQGSNMTISIKTKWHLSYDRKLKSRLEKEVGLLSIPDPRERCGWHSMQNVWKNAVHRGSVEYHIPKLTTTNKTPPPFPPPLQSQITTILETTYPTLEIGLILGFTLGLFLPFTIYCCNGIRRYKKAMKKRGNQKMDSVLPTSVQGQHGLYPPPVEYGQIQQPAPTFSYPCGRY